MLNPKPKTIRDIACFRKNLAKITPIRPVKSESTQRIVSAILNPPLKAPQSPPFAHSAAFLERAIYSLRDGAAIHNSSKIFHTSEMNEISQQLLYQRLRNRIIELLDMYCSFDDLAKFGAFEALNMVDDWLPLDYDKAPNVFNDQEKRVVAEFIQLVEAASNATDEDTWDVNWFKSANEWVHLSAFAKSALPVLLERGRFSEEFEEPSLT